MAARAQVIPFEKVPQQVPPFPIRAASNHTRGVRTFYVTSESKPGVEYVVQFIRRSHQCRWFCDCADFKFRRVFRRRHCKHLRQITAMVRAAGGVRRLVHVIVAAATQPTAA